MSEAVIRALGLHKRFTEGGLDVHVLQGVDMSVQRGETLAVVGALAVALARLRELRGDSAMVRVLGIMAEAGVSRYQLSAAERSLSGLRRQATGETGANRMLPPFDQFATRSGAASSAAASW